MTTTDAGAMTRVTSRDGTPIACWASGDGPPLVLVHGTTADHTRWGPLLPSLEPHVTVCAVDRRGRGASGDGPDYDITREFEDVAAVVDAVARAVGTAVDVYGHSYGAFCSLGAAMRTSNIRKLVLYEPPVEAATRALPPEVIERMVASLAAGDQEAVIETMFRDVVGMSAEELDAFRALPAWQARVVAAHTVPRELRVDLGAAFDRDRASRMTTPTLMLVGGDSPDSMKADTELVAATLTDVRVEFLEGQQHAADVLVPARFAEHVLPFLKED